MALKKTEYLLKKFKIGTLVQIIETLKKSNTLKHLRRPDLIAFFFCVVFFTAFAPIDLAISQLFYDKNQGGFYLDDHFLLVTIYTISDVTAVAILVLLVTIIGLSFIVKKDALLRRRKALFFLLSAFILGPGIIVNLVLKDHWDRPRPRQVIEFGGSKTFEPPFAPNFSCDKCHSFVSGHASVGFYFFAIALLSRNRKWLLVPVIAGSIIGVVRIAQGGHFISDIIFSGFVVWFCSLFLYLLFFKSGPERNESLNSA